jgi:hypothetical protein
MLRFIKYKKAAAIKPPSIGEITQLAAILPKTTQLAIFHPPAAIPAPNTPLYLKIYSGNSLNCAKIRTIKINNQPLGEAWN